MHNGKEYVICRQISDFIRYQYPDVIWRFDLAGLNLSKAQAGMSKALQCAKGYPDLFVMEPRNGCHGLFIEVKKDGERLTKQNGDYASEHIFEQAEYMRKLKERGYQCFFAVGFDEAVKIIKDYLG